MQIIIRLPDQVLYTGQALKVYGEAENGSFSILPNHADFITSLVPSVFLITEKTTHERFFGLDQGLLMKNGRIIEVIARRGVEGSSLQDLAIQMQRSFSLDDEQERQARSALAKLEIGMAKQFRELNRPI